MKKDGRDRSMELDDFRSDKSSQARSFGIRNESKFLTKPMKERCKRARIQRARLKPQHSCSKVYRGTRPGAM